MLCELEGVLVDTTGLRRDAMMQAVSGLGGSLPDDWRSEPTAAPVLPADARLAATAAGLPGDDTTLDLLGLAASRAFTDLLALRAVTLVRGADTLLAEAAARTRVAIVTRARRREAEMLLAQAPFAGSIAFVVAEEDAAPKPSAAPYEAALRRLRMPLTDAPFVLALEHAVPGIASAVRAGLRCVAVGPFEHDPAAVPHAALPTLEGVTFDRLMRLSPDPEVAT